MDPIKNQIAAIDPFEPGTEPSGEEALHRMLSGSTVYSDTNPLRNVSSLEDKRRRKARIAGGLLWVQLPSPPESWWHRTLAR